MKRMPIAGLLLALPAILGSAHAADPKAAALARLEKQEKPFTEAAFVTWVGLLDQETVGTYLDAGMSPDAKNNKGVPALVHLTAKEGVASATLSAHQQRKLDSRVAMLKLLLKRGAQPDLCDAEGSTPLHRAAEFGPYAVLIPVLVKAGASLEILDTKYSATPLQTAVVMKNPAGAEALLAAGAKPDTAGRNGATALIFAANGGSSAMLPLLLEHGADPNVADRNGTRPLHMAARSGRADLVRLLLAKGAQKNATTLNGMTALMAVPADCQDPEIRGLLQ
jgi:ankyrin repeat protein